IENIATVGGEDTPPVDTPTDPNPAYTFAKSVSDASGDGKAQSGEVLTYTITVTNTGDVDYNAIVIHDKIPAHTTFVDGSATGGAVPNSEGELEWVVDVPFGGSVSVGFQVTVADNLTGADRSEERRAGSEGGSRALAAPRDPKPATRVRQAVWDATRDGKAQSGEVLNYTITVTNTVDVELAGIPVVDLSPALTSYVAGSAGAGGALAGEELSWLVDVPFGGSVSVGFQVTVADNLTGADKIENIATVGGEDTPPVDTPTDPNPAYTFAKSVSDASGDGKAQSGEVLTYTITVTNTGDVDLAGIPVVDLIPAHTSYVAGSATAGGTLAGEELSWLVDVPFGGAVSVGFQVTVSE